MRLLPLVLFLVGYFAILFVMSIPKGMVPPIAADVTWGTLSSLGILALTAMMQRQTATTQPHLRISAGTVTQFALGIALGVGVYLLTLAVIHLTVGPLQLGTPPAPPAAHVIVFAVLGVLALSLMEELGFRGFLMQSLRTSHGALVAIVVTSLLFAFFHLLFGWPLNTVLLGVLPSGVLFGVAALVSGGLAMPIALHAAVNFTMWVMGEKSTPGFVTLTLDPTRLELAGRVTPVIGAVVPLVVSAALWRWYPRPDLSQ